MFVPLLDIAGNIHLISYIAGCIEDGYGKFPFWRRLSNAFRGVPISVEEHSPRPMGWAPLAHFSRAEFFACVKLRVAFPDSASWRAPGKLPEWKPGAGVYTLR